jgi:hypothetical protein
MKIKADQIFFLYVNRQELETDQLMMITVFWDVTSGTYELFAGTCCHHIEVRFPAGTRDCPLRHSLQTDYEAHPASSPLST